MTYYEIQEKDENTFVLLSPVDETILTRDEAEIFISELDLILYGYCNYLARVVGLREEARDYSVTLPFFSDNTVFSIAQVQELRGLLCKVALKWTKKDFYIYHVNSNQIFEDLKARYSEVSFKARLKAAKEF